MRNSRLAARVVALSVSTAFLLVGGGVGSPAWAAAPPVDGVSKPLGAVNTVLIFVVLPLGVFGLVALLTLRPGASPGAQRYRPGRGWGAGPVLLGGHTTEDGALALTGDVASDMTGQAGPGDEGKDIGGASGSW